MIILIKRYLLVAGIGALVLLGLYLYLAWRLGRSSIGAGSPASASKAALPSDDKEQIIVDPRTHTITIKRPGKTTTTHLPERPTTVDVRKDGSVRVTAQQFGFERRLFVGAGYSDALRFGLGIDYFYWKALDLGGGFQINSQGKDARVFVGVSYTVKDNLRLTLTIDHKKTIGGMLSLRL